ncbi:hypothetical protein [Limnohabitans sp. Bal53]|uniref:hypothetical protein n=1 Tax=Limnohabitans sp. Bal53 TaxID=1977910 RepID=UPI0011B1D482|nr:hypothetical protein [Limnohabitans sp. Bal53]
MKFSMKRSAAYVAATFAALTAAGCASNLPAPPSSPTACAGLNGIAIAPQAIGMPTTGAVVTSAVVVPAAGTGVAAVAEYCKVLGEINPVGRQYPLQGSPNS